MSYGRYILSGKQDLVVALPLGNVQKSANLLNARLLHPFHQPPSPSLSCMSNQQLVHHNTGIYADKLELAQLQTWEGLRPVNIKWQPGVSSQGPLTNNAPFASVLGESGNPFTICSRGLKTDMDIWPSDPTFRK